MTHYKVNYVSNKMLSVIQGASSIILIKHGIYGFMNMNTIKNGSDFLLMISMLFGGIGVLIAGINHFKLTRAYKRYITILNNNRNGSIKAISKVTKEPEDEIIVNLQRLINNRTFDKAYIDFDQRRIIFQPTSNYNLLSSKSVKKKDKFIIVNCPKCGGENNIKEGTIDSCEYCDSEIF